MTFQGDPFRTLGVVPGASLNEIKSAYRRLVKQFHPDAAGERALSRFLSIQAAYEQLVDGEGRLRARAPGGTPSGTAGWQSDARSRASREAWRARRASWGGAGGPSSGDPRQRPGGSTPGSSGRSAGTGSAPGRGERQAGGDRSGRERRRDRSGGTRGPRKATPGSTTYDEAHEGSRDPEWEGATWYGASSGTYWTINPREYADPRKHGPEYQARARRAGAAEPGGAAGSTGADRDGPAGPRGAAWPGGATGAGAEASSRPPSGAPTGPGAGAPGRSPRTSPGSPPASGTGATPEQPPETESTEAEARWRWSGEARSSTTGDPRDWAATGWSYRSGEAPAGAAGPASSPGGARPGSPPGGAGAGPRRAETGSPPWSGHAAAGPSRGRGAARSDRERSAAHERPAQPPPSLPDLEAVARRAAPDRLLAAASGRDLRTRFVIALLAWPPAGFAVATLVAGLLGCGDLAPVCPAPLSLVPLLVQPLVLAGLMAVPLLAAASAFASLVALGVAVVLAVLLSIAGGTYEPRASGLVLGVGVAVAYAVALVFGLVLARRGPAAAARRSDGAPGDPGGE
jgi:curved DNA-binding protein CbpA